MTKRRKTMTRRRNMKTRGIGKMRKRNTRLHRRKRHHSDSVHSMTQTRKTTLMMKRRGVT